MEVVRLLLDLGALAGSMLLCPPPTARRSARLVRCWRACGSVCGREGGRAGEQTDLRAAASLPAPPAAHARPVPPRNTRPSARC